EDLMSNWSSAYYTFYEPKPKIEYVDGRRMHSFKCSSPQCKVRVRRYLDKQDASSTSGLQHHAEKCWGLEAVNAAKEAVSLDVARKEIVGSILRTGSI
ncbi:hypothetical protein C8T65DRAFT_545473, partial [Cerioporus squamosus]